MTRLSGALSLVVCALLATVFVSACGGVVDDPNAPVGVKVEQTYLTIVNRSGSAFAGGQIERPVRCARAIQDANAAHRVGCEP